MSDIDENPPALFTPEEMRTLRVLRARYQHDHHCLCARERAQLQFLVWLSKSGRLTSHPESEASREDGSTGGTVDQADDEQAAPTPRNLQH